VTATPLSVEGAYVGTSGWSYPSWKPGFYPAELKLTAYRTSQVATFEERVTRLGDRLGPIRVLVGAKRDEGLLALLLGSLDPSLRLAFDFRHQSWEDVELPPNAVRVDDLARSAGFRYLRFRDPPYSEAELRDCAERIAPLLAQGVEVFAYFRHEDEPTAPEYAQCLTRFLADFTSTAEHETRPH
jgi:uncharacterized protein YecE (DUF72 family)